MNEQIGVALPFQAFFTAAKVGKTGLTVTVDTYKVDTAGTASSIATAQSAVAVGGGLYSYLMPASANTAEGSYLAVFKTTDTTVDQQHIPSLWLVGKAAVEDLDAAISSRNAVAPDNASVATLVGRLTAVRAALLDNLTPAALAAAIWNALNADYDVMGTKGHNSNVSGAAADPLTNPVPGAYASGSAGFALGRLATGAAEIVMSAPPVSSDGLTITLLQGDSYTDADGRPLTWTNAAWRDLTSATVTLHLDTPGVETTFSVVVTAPRALKVELTAAQTETLRRRQAYRLVAVWSDGTVETLVSGMLYAERRP